MSWAIPSPKGRIALVASLCLLSTSAGLERSFHGSYTIVNKASGRRIVSDLQGFYTEGAAPISQSHTWKILPQGNNTFAITNAATGVRIYAQLNADREHGFFIIGSDGPVYQDQKWQLWLQEDGSYLIVNLKSGRTVADSPLGLVAVAGEYPKAEEAMWWLINQERDEFGALLFETQRKAELAVANCLEVSLEHASELKQAELKINETSSALQALKVVNKKLRQGMKKTELRLRAERAARIVAEADSVERAAQAEQSLPTDTISVIEILRPLGTGVVALMLVAFTWTAFAGRLHKGLGCKLEYHVSSSESDGDTIRHVRVQCPGVKHDDIKVGLIPNGCEVTIRRQASLGLEALTWHRRFCFDLAEGLYEFKEDQMQLEQGVLQLVFRKIRYEDRTIRFAQHYSLEAFDDDLCWEYPSAEDDVCEEDDCKVQPADAVSVGSLSTASSRRQSASARTA